MRIGETLTLTVLIALVSCCNALNLPLIRDEFRSIQRKDLTIRDETPKDGTDSIGPVNPPPDDIWGPLDSFSACNLISGGYHYDVSIHIGPVPGALGNPRAYGYTISRRQAVEFTRSVMNQIQAEMAVNPRDAAVPLGWTVRPNNNFRIDVMQRINPVNGRPIMPLGYFMLAQAMQNIRNILNRDPMTTITDGQLYIRLFLPTSSPRSVCRPDGTPVATVTITRTHGTRAQGVSGPPTCLERLQGTTNMRTRGQILFGDRFPGLGDYYELPGGP